MLKSIGFLQKVYLLYFRNRKTKVFVSKCGRPSALSGCGSESHFSEGTAHTSSKVPESSPMAAARVSSPTGPPFEIYNKSSQDLAVQFVQTILIYIQKVQSKACNIVSDPSIIFHLGKITDTLLTDGLQDGGFPGAHGDLSGTFHVNFYSKYLGRAHDDCG